MSIKKIYVKNLPPVPDGEWELGNGHVLVTGSNGQGKSTFATVMWRMLTDNFPAPAISGDKTKGEPVRVRFETSEGIAVEINTPAPGQPGEKVITLTTPDGKVKTNPALKVLGDVVGANLDLRRDFIDARPADRAKFLAKQVVDLEAETAAVKAAETAFTEANRRAKEAETRAEGYDPEMPAVPVDLKPLQAALTAAQTAQATAGEAAAKAQTKREAYKKLKAEIEAMAAKLAAMKDDLAALHAEGVELAAAAQTAADPTLLQAAVDSAQKDLDEAIAANTERALNGQRQKFYLESETAAAALVAAKKAVDEARAARTAKAAQAQLPAGISISEAGDILYTDKKGVVVPLDYANKAAVSVVALMLGLRSVGKIRAAYIDMSHLDAANRREVFEWATANDLQLWAEKATETGPFHLEIVETF